MLDEGLYLEWGCVCGCCTECYIDIFGLAIHTTPIGHRVSELGDNSVSVHHRWNMCPFHFPLLLPDQSFPNISSGYLAEGFSA